MAKAEAAASSGVASRELETVLAAADALVRGLREAVGCAPNGDAPPLKGKKAAGEREAVRLVEILRGMLDQCEKVGPALERIRAPLEGLGVDQGRTAAIGDVREWWWTVAVIVWVREHLFTEALIEGLRTSTTPAQCDRLFHRGTDGSSLRRECQCMSAVFVEWAHRIREERVILRKEVLSEESSSATEVIQIDRKRGRYRYMGVSGVLSMESCALLWEMRDQSCMLNSHLRPRVTNAWRARENLPPSLRKLVVKRGRGHVLNARVEEMNPAG